MALLTTATRELYGTCGSYMDTAVIESHLNSEGNGIGKKVTTYIATAFVRPLGFRFEYKVDVTPTRRARHALSRQLDGAVSHSWNMKEKVELPLVNSLDEALWICTGTTCGTCRLIPSLLLPNEISSGITSADSDEIDDPGATKLLGLQFALDSAGLVSEVSYTHAGRGLRARHRVAYSATINGPVDENLFTRVRDDQLLLMLEP